MDAEISFDRNDILAQLNKEASLSKKMEAVHEATRSCCDFIHRISVALYDPKCDLIKTYSHSTEDKNPLPNYQARLANTPSLKSLSLSGNPRVINDMHISGISDKLHANRLIENGFRASYTIPMYANSRLTGFIFFNSRLPNVFNTTSLAHLDIIARLISLLVQLELNLVSTLHGALRTAARFSSYRDPETGAHIDRMSHFSRLIAGKIAHEMGLDDEFAENILWASPMHDIGKIAIPDHILLKPGKLTTEEFELMKTHSRKGQELIDNMLNNFNFGDSPIGTMMSNIAAYHHENMDGSGYPYGLKGEAIPLEARIVAVADVFDALTSERCYKQAWSNDRAFSELDALSTWKLDPRCVEILLENKHAIEDIQLTFRDQTVA